MLNGYITNLGKYNEGKLVGKWIEFPITEEELEEVFEEIGIDVIFYAGQTLEDVAYDIVQECYNLPEIAERYFDYKAFARDLSFDGYTETSNGVIYYC